MDYNGGEEGLEQDRKAQVVVEQAVKSAALSYEKWCRGGWVEE